MQHVESRKIPLLREYTRKGIVGSNPIFSASKPLKISVFLAFGSRLRSRSCVLILTYFNVNDSRTCSTPRGKSGGSGFPHVLHPQFFAAVDDRLQCYDETERWDDGNLWKPV